MAGPGGKHQACHGGNSDQGAKNDYGDQNNRFRKIIEGWVIKLRWLEGPNNQMKIIETISTGSEDKLNAGNSGGK